MKGFALENGDIVIKNGEIQMVHGKHLTMQTIKSVWQTKKGEWFFDWEEGIDRESIMGKKQVDEDTIWGVLQEGLTQIDTNLTLDSLACSFDKSTRLLSVSCVVRNIETNETYTIEDAI